MSFNEHRRIVRIILYRSDGSYTKQLNRLTADYPGYVVGGRIYKADRLIVSLYKRG